VNTRSRWVGVALMAVVFVAGGVSGIAVDRAFGPSTLEGREGERGRPFPRDAAPSGGRRPPPGLGGRGAGPTVRVPILRELDLTPEQWSRVDSIVEGRRREMARTWEENQASFRVVIQTAEEELIAVLTPEQREEYRTRVREAGRGRPGGGRPLPGGGPGMPPPR
jgi:Spy/CpxP family protein refolding chaperone